MLVTNPLVATTTCLSARWRGYPAYKDSGIEWLGEIPESWRIERAKTVFKEVRDLSLDGSETLLAVSEYTGVTPRSEILDEGQYLTRAESLEGYKRCRQDDLVMNIMLAWKHGLGVAPCSGIVSPAYSVFRVINGSYPRLLHYLLRSNEYAGLFRMFSYGVIQSRWRLYPEVFLGLPILLPPDDKQRVIAAFLDRETGRIDALIEKKQRQIELLQEKRSALITHAVTKGLDPNVKMKDSGVEWLGEIPEHWEVKRLKRIAGLRSGESITSDEIEEAGKYPVYGCNGLRGYTSSYTHEGNYVLIGRQGALCGCVNYATGRFWASEHAVVVSPIKEMPVKWLGELLRTMNLNQYSQSAAQPGLAVDRIAMLPVPIPPLSEQLDIATLVSHGAATEIEGLAKVQRSIDLLREYRTVLISAAVTGRIDVRKEVA